MKFYKFLCQLVTLKPRKKPLDEPLYKLSAGRSMVEMLGVLAIIGVLSVGAIAGYSRAMLKYKINRYSESFNLLINNILQVRPKLSSGSDFNCNLFDKLGITPDSMECKNNLLYDIFGNFINVSYYNKEGGAAQYIFTTNFPLTNNTFSAESKEVCRNMILVAKQNADNIYAVDFRVNDSNGSYSSKVLNGNLHSSKQNRLVDADIKKIDDICSSCNSETSCSIAVYTRF